jgi:hypothetical protein
LSDLFGLPRARKSKSTKFESNWTKWTKNVALSRNSSRLLSP